MNSLLSRTRHAAGLALAGALLCLGGARAQAQQPGGQFLILNDTLSGGDPVYSVATDVTFTNLLLTETWSGGRTVTGRPLYDGTGTAGTSLDTGQIELDSAAFPDPSPTLGTLTSATLTGDFSIDGLLPNPDGTWNFDIQPALDPSSLFTTAVDPGFTATLNPAMPGDGFVNINATDAKSGAIYAAGQFQLRPAAVPEPSSLALLGVAALGAAPILRRRLRAAHGSVNEGEQSCA